MLPVRVDTGLVLDEARVPASKLASDEMESWLWELRLADLDLLRALSPSNNPSLMYKSLCELFLGG